MNLKKKDIKTGQIYNYECTEKNKHMQPAFEEHCKLLVTCASGSATYVIFHCEEELHPGKSPLSLRYSAKGAPEFLKAVILAFSCFQVN